MKHIIAIPPIFLWLFIVTTTFITAYSAFFLTTTILLVRNSEKTIGTVAELKITPSHINGRMMSRQVKYTPVVTFTTTDGRNITYTSNVSVDNMIVYSVGTKVPVIYQKDRPQNARIDSFFQTWAGAVTFPFGLFFLSLEFFGLYKADKKRANPTT